MKNLEQSDKKTNFIEFSLFEIEAGEHFSTLLLFGYDDNFSYQIQTKLLLINMYFIILYEKH